MLPAMKDIVVISVMAGVGVSFPELVISALSAAPMSCGYLCKHPIAYFNHTHLCAAMQSSNTFQQLANG